MKGSIKQRSSGSWTLTLYLGRKPDGKPQQKCVTVRGTKKEADKELRRLLSAVDTGTFTDPGRLTVADYLEEWLRNIPLTHSPRTVETYASLLRRHVIPAVGQRPLAQLTPRALQALYTELRENGRSHGTGGLAPQSVRHVHTVLGTALAGAVRQGLLAVNPCTRVDPPAVPPGELNVAPEAEFPALLAAARPADLYPAVLLAVTAGLRRGECLALRWADVDLEAGRITVRRSLVQLTGSLLTKSPKSGKGRAVVLPAAVVAELRRLKGEQAQRRLLLGDAYHARADLVCCRADGRYLRPDVTSHAFARLLKQAGLKPMRFHDLRHSHATWLLSQGIHPKIASERLGHASIAVTMNTYSHVLPDMQTEAAERLDRALRQALP